MRYGGRIGGLVVAALLLAPGSAAALQDYGDADVQTDTLFVTGEDSVTYADGEGRYDDGFAVVRRSPGSRTRLARLPAPPGRDRFYQYTDFAASGQRWAWGVAEYAFGGIEDEPVEFNFHSGAGQEGEGVLECSGDPGVPNVAVAGNAVAFQPGTCTGRNLVVRDFTAGGPTRTIPLTESVAELRAAGRYVAYALSPRSAGPGSPERQIVVYDWVEGREVYRARSSEAAPFLSGPEFAPFDIQADGKVVVVAAGGDPSAGSSRCDDLYSVAWFSPAEPTAHVLPVKSCVPDYKIEGDRIAFFRNDGTSRGARLVVSDLAGTSVANLARFEHYRLGQHFDVGSFVAYSARTCLEHRLFREELAPAAEAVYERPACPIRIRSSAGRISAGGVASVRYSCLRGCNLYTRVQKPFSSAIKAARIKPGRTGTVNFRVPPSVRARLQRQGSITMRVFAGIDDTLPVTKRNFAANVQLRAR